MKLLLDQGLPRSAARCLREAGVDAVHTAEAGLATASDAAVLAAARQQGRALITLDADFHALLALSGAEGPSAVRIRIEGLQGEPLARLVQTVLERCESDLEKGAAVTVTDIEIRVHHLPIVRRGTKL
jgi:predicted nuclease of predicted toxin-antitoxin system